jgi:hypothetical protein
LAYKSNVHYTSHEVKNRHTAVTSINISTSFKHTRENKRCTLHNLLMRMSWLCTITTRLFVIIQEVSKIRDNFSLLLQSHISARLFQFAGVLTQSLLLKPCRSHPKARPALADNVALHSFRNRPVPEQSDLAPPLIMRSCGIFSPNKGCFTLAYILQIQQRERCQH